MKCKMQNAKCKMEGENEMKKYLNPEIEIVALSNDDILTTSPGTETPWYEETDGSWEISAKA